MASLRFVSNPAVGIRTTALFSQRGPSPKGVTFLNARARPARELRFGYGARNSCRAPAFRYHQVWAGEARHDEEHEETSMVARVQAATESLLASGSQMYFNNIIKMNISPNTLYELVDAHSPTTALTDSGARKFSFVVVYFPNVKIDSA